MSDNDQFTQTVEAIYAGGVQSDRLPVALEAASHLLGAAGATFEVMDMAAQRHTEFWSVGTPTGAETQYLEQFAALNPRIPFAARQPGGKVVWDYLILDEREMARDPFYAEFLPPLGLRYCLGAVLERTPDKLVAFSVQRTREARPRR